MNSAPITNSDLWVPDTSIVTPDDVADLYEEDQPQDDEKEPDEPFTPQEMAACRKLLEKLRQTAVPDWQVRGFSDASTGDTQPPWIIKGYLLGESASLTSAHPHSLKSISWLYAAMEAPLTKKVFNYFDAAHVERSLFIETEDPEWLVKARIRGFAKGLGVSDIPGFNFVCPGPFDLVNFENQLGNLLDKYRPSFAVLSTLQNLLEGRDWAKPAEMQPVNAGIIRLSRKYCPLAVITHSPWDKKQKRAAGTVTQTANFMVTTHFEKAMNRKTNETFAHVVVDSKGGSVVDDFTLKLETAGSSDDPESVRKVLFLCEGWPKGLGRDAVIAEIERDPEASPKEIADRTGMSVRYVQQIIKEMIARIAQPKQLKVTTAKRTKKSARSGLLPSIDATDISEPLDELRCS